MVITKTILSDPCNKWVMRTSPSEVFVVGGYIRDLMLGHESKDRDYILRHDAEGMARKAAKKFQGTFLILKKGSTYRVVVKGEKEDKKHHKTLDFSLLKSSILNDLRERDFTMNAIAWAPEAGIVDPFDGEKDLKKGIIRTVRARNLYQDPLRIIRAYRFAAELGFRIEKNTRKNLSYYSKHLKNVANERITEEFFKILNNITAGKYINKCLKDGILEKIFSMSSKAEKRKLQGMEFEKIMKELDKTVNTLNLKKGKKEGIFDYFQEEVSQGLKRIGLIRLFLLFQGMDVSESMLRTSKVINKAINDMSSGYSTFEYYKEKKALTKKELFKIFYKAGDSVHEVALVLSLIRRTDVKELLKKANDFLKIKNKKLLNGYDVQNILKITSGAKVGKILEALKEKQIDLKVKTKAQARKWIIYNYT
jgi:tRNA nucleotidyltransferase/poly(A) polymerase